MRTLIAAAVTAMLALPAAASDAKAAAPAAKPSLRDVREIEDPLFAVAIAKEVADHCGSLAPRYFRGLGELRRLKARANALGYSDAEIRAYIEADAEKDRMRAKGEKLLAQNGVEYGEPETFCAYGRAEIEKNSAIGVLLRAK
ncbi:DUF5333 domain-containing protein [Cribrihabitans pelagius]|uniref:DUF5333 domain-containing protein n=1 Tax=Cribrihabitans pelagius TaxID=1765746 RepID=UPI003B593D4F